MDILDPESEAFRQSVMETVKQDIQVCINTSRTGNLETLEASVEMARSLLAKLPCVRGVLVTREDQSYRFGLIDTRRILGVCSASFRQWGDEYSNRRGRHLDILAGVIKAVGTDSLERVLNRIFYITKKDYTSGIRLYEIEGISDFAPFYIVSDGTHRVSFCKRIGLERIPSYVNRADISIDLATTDLSAKTWWTLLAEAGFIKISTIRSGDAFGDTVYFCKLLERPQLPWCTMCTSINQMVGINQAYEEANPGALDNIRSIIDGNVIPKEVLLDIEALRSLV